MEKMGAFFCQSKTIQNKLIEYVAEEITSYIDHEIDECSFFTCKVDRATDISHLGQLSLVLCQMDKKRKTQERFMGFKDVSIDQKAVVLKQVVDSVIRKYDYKRKRVS
ncbi:unnamed protein product [Caretta caretta]